MIRSIFLSFFAVAVFFYSMASMASPSTPLCYESAAGVCTDVTSSTPLPMAVYGGSNGQCLVSNGTFFAPGSCSGSGGSGTLTNFSFVNGNGFTGTVLNATTTPSLSLTTTGSTGIATVGTITTGTWQGTPIAATYLPTGSGSVPGILQCGSGTSCSGGVITASGGGSSVSLSSTTSNNTYYLTFANATSGTLTTLFLDGTTPLTYNPTTGISVAPGLTTNSLTSTTSSALQGTTTISGSLFETANSILSGTTTISGALNATATVNANNINVTGSTAPINGIYLPSSNQVGVSANSIESAAFNTLSSGVDYITVTPGKSGTNPLIAVNGTTSNQGLKITATGTGAVTLNGGSTAANAVVIQQAGTTIAAFGNSTNPAISLSGGHNIQFYAQASSPFSFGSFDATSNGGLLNLNSSGGTCLGFDACGQFGLSGGAQNNTVIGNRVASTTLSSGVSNVIIGTGSGSDTALGNTSTSIAIGGKAGNFDTGVGYGSLAATSTNSNDNAAFGYQALNATTSNAGAVMNDSAFGYQAGKLITTGSSNLVLGALAGTTSLATGSDDILIGGLADTTTPGASHELHIHDPSLAAGTDIISCTGTGTNSTQTCTINGTLNSPSGSQVISTAGTGMSKSGSTLNSNAVYQISFQPGLITSITNTKSVFAKVSKASTVDNIEGSAMVFSCVSNPTITMYECGTDPACATSPTTIGSVTVTSAGTAVDGTVSSAAITAGDYVAFAVSAGTCTSLDISANAQVHSN